eukprot:6133648-Pyramimonas_sp.AAC.2
MQQQGLLGSQIHSAVTFAQAPPPAIFGPARVEVGLDFVRVALLGERPSKLSNARVCTLGRTLLSPW